MFSYNIKAIQEDSEFKYYFLGFLAADGWISDKSNRVELCLNEKDKDILTIMRDIIVPGKNISYRPNINAYKLTIDNREIMDEVSKFIMRGNKTQSLIFPYGIPDQYFRHFVRGYIDGDGNIGVKRGQKIFEDNIKYYFGLRLRVLGTRAFLQGLVINIQRLIDNKIVGNPHKKENENVYYVEFGFSVAKKILDFIYQDAIYKLDRKYKVFQIISNSDSDVLAKNYGTPDGHYNMQSAVETQ